MEIALCKKKKHILSLHAWILSCNILFCNYCDIDHQMFILSYLGECIMPLMKWRWSFCSPCWSTVCSYDCCEDIKNRDLSAKLLHSCTCLLCSSHSVFM